MNHEHHRGPLPCLLRNMKNWQVAYIRNQQSLQDAAQDNMRHQAKVKMIAQRGGTSPCGAQTFYLPFEILTEPYEMAHAKDS